MLFSIICHSYSIFLRFIFWLLFAAVYYLFVRFFLLRKYLRATFLCAVSVGYCFVSISQHPVYIHVRVYICKYINIQVYKRKMFPISVIISFILSNKFTILYITQVFCILRAFITQFKIQN